MRAINIIFILAFCFVVVVQSVQGQCDCMSPNICRTVSYSENIIIAKAKENKIQNGWNVSVVEVERVFKGNLSGDIIVTFHLKVGDRFLLYPYFEKEKNIWSVFGCCTRDVRLEKAGGDIAYLEKLKNEKISNRIYGTIQNYSTKEYVSARVDLIGGNRIYELVSDESGFYAIDNLPNGRYRVRPKPPENLKISAFEWFYRPNGTSEIEIDLIEGSCYEINPILIPTKEKNNI